MAQPPAYAIQTDFSADESSNLTGRSTVRTANLDTELTNIQAFVSAMRSNIALIQSDDGTIKDDAVDLATLSDSVINWISTNGNGWYSQDAGTVNAMVVTLDPAPTSLSNGMFVVSDMKLTNTSTMVTLNVNGLGAKEVVTDGAGSSPTSGLLTIGTFYGFQYDSSQDKFQIVFSGDSLTHASTCITKASEASASASDANTAKIATEGYLDTFTDQYLGAFATLPTVDLDGDPLTDGDLAYDTTLNLMFVYDLATTTWLRLRPTTSEQNAINGVNTIASDVSNVSSVSSAVSNLSSISGDVTTCSNNSANITTTAQNIAGVNSFGQRYRVSGSEPTTNNDAGDLHFNTSTNELRSFGTVWQATAPSNDNQNNINIVAGDIVHAEDLGSITSPLTTGSGNGDISTVATNIADINSVANSSNLANVNLVGGSIANVNLTGASIASVNSVSSSIASVNSVHSNIASVNTCATDIQKIVDTANDLNEAVSEIDVCATNIASINAVGTDIANVNAVASDSTDIGVVAGKATEIGLLGTSANVTSMGNLGTSGNVTNMATCSTNIASINTVAGASSGINFFNERYRVSASAPTQDLDAGDLYFDTTLNELKSYGTSWQSTAPSASDQLNINAVAGALIYQEDLGSVADAISSSSATGTINTVANNISAVNLLGTSDAVSDMNQIATVSNIASINNVSGSIANVNTVSGLSSAIASVNSISSEITAVNTQATEIGLLGTSAVVSNLANLGTASVVSDLSTLGTSGNVTALNNVSGSIANVNSVATGLADVNRYADEYTIASSSPGSPSVGDLWYDSTANSLKYRTASSWVAIAPGLTAVADDASPQLAGALDCQNNNISNCGTVAGANLQMDFGGLT